MCEEWIENGQDSKQEMNLYAIAVIHEKTMAVMMEEKSEDSGGIL